MVTSIHTIQKSTRNSQKLRSKLAGVDERYYIPKGGTIFLQYSDILCHCEITVNFCLSPVQRLYQVKTFSCIFKSVNWKQHAKLPIIQTINL